MPNFTICNSIIAKLRVALLDSWYQKSRWFTYLLLPFSFIFAAIVFVRRKLYQWGIKKSTRFSVPVIVVGNLTVGGSGKSPLVAFLAQYFASKGYKPGIVLRGYKAKAKQWPQTVNSDSDPALVGDEALMLAQQTQVPIVAGPDRVVAVQQLLQEFNCDLVLSDDGLQHYALQRRIEIVVLDGKHGLGNGYCLPAGPLRETAQRLRAVNFVVLNGGIPKGNEYAMQLTPNKIYKLCDHTQSWALPLEQKTIVHAIAGIGFPERFFNSLSQLGFDVIPHPFPDHHDFSFVDIDLPDYPIIMTTKDAVKCQAFADKRHWCLGVQAELDPPFFTALERALASSPFK